MADIDQEKKLADLDKVRVDVEKAKRELEHRLHVEIDKLTLDRDKAKIDLEKVKVDFEKAGYDTKKSALDVEKAKRELEHRLQVEIEKLTLDRDKAKADLDKTKVDVEKAVQEVAKLKVDIVNAPSVRRGAWAQLIVAGVALFSACITATNYTSIYQQSERTKASEEARQFNDRLHTLAGEIGRYPIEPSMSISTVSNALDQLEVMTRPVPRPKGLVTQMTHTVADVFFGSEQPLQRLSDRERMTLQLIHIVDGLDFAIERHRALASIIVRRWPEFFDTDVEATDNDRRKVVWTVPLVSQVRNRVLRLIQNGFNQEIHAHVEFWRSCVRIVSKQIEVKCPDEDAEPLGNRAVVDTSDFVMVAQAFVDISAGDRRASTSTVPNPERLKCVHEFRLTGMQDELIAHICRVEPPLPPPHPPEAAAPSPTPTAGGGA